MAKVSPKLENLVNLILNAKINRKLQTMAKTRKVKKTTYMCVQNLMSLVLSAKINRKWQKMIKTYTIQKVTCMWHSESKC